MTSLGFQASSLKAFLTIPEDVLGTFRKLSDMGYRVVQLQWISPDVPDEFVADALRETRLTCVSTQDYYSVVSDNLGRFIQMNKLWNSCLMCVSGIPREKMSVEGLLAFSVELGQMADVLRENGLILTFHPRVSDYTCIEGRPAVDWLMDGMPDDAQLTIDFYSVVKAGLNPIKLLERYSGRVDMVHFKDSVILPDGRENLMPVGQGHIAWPEIFEACQKAGVKWGFAEQESWQKDAFICAHESYEYITSHGILSPP
ncbi:sugar phosphate isomerase/epimerase family protein [Paenibacillus agricola]|uniref:TIM barrel protein n=1 Tax=Paenibacillus agricola TaxID=2716264 RepID=A0ABX0JHX8_9BACL|nr:sugar phosphate isomerase/epimerase [Paenibacillus agricola]NHN35451.1 TIM barrel protein [Paenibacillus agricola]